jgi:hypothetical protein
MENSVDQQVKFKEIDQLHSTLMEFNKNSIEIKKLCAALFTAIPVFLFTINGDVFKQEYFLISLVVCVAFLIVDAHYYYNQRKIRAAMNNIKQSLIGDIKIGIEAKKVGFWGAIFNTSNSIYAFFIALNIILFVWGVKI